MENRKISVVLATYSGLGTIEASLKSLLSQQSSLEYELIIIVDGPNQKLINKIEQIIPKFKKIGVLVTFKVLKKNKGRFLARLEGAKIATTEQLLIIDDRIELSSGYLKKLIKIDQPIVMPNVIESLQSGRSIALFLQKIRSKLYPDKLGKDFADYFIDTKNFERAPKGTAALWIGREVFINACSEFIRSNQKNESKYVNEDTKILRKIVDDGHRIFRTSKLNIIYTPRDDLKQEIRHLYSRGPRFVDYYLKPRTRFFLPLLIFYFSVIFFGLVFLVKPLLILIFILVILIFNFVFSVYLADNLKQAPKMFYAGCIVSGAFSLGLIKGLLIKLKSQVR